MTADDMELLREYATRQSESAFAALVTRHANLVYSAALRQLQSPQLAEEVTQAVFVLLARKAGSLDSHTILPSWLYRAACYVSASALKQELRRQRREQEAYMQSTLNEPQSDAAWRQLAPLLDEAMLRLNQSDRDTLVLRFFEGRSVKEVGAALGASDEAAKKRINRAVEKLRLFFTKRGVAISGAVLVTAISTHSVQAAPAALAKSATSIAMAKGTSASTLTLMKGALKIMAWTKTKTTIAVGMGILLVGGTTTVAIQEIRAHWVEIWRREYHPSIMGQIPQQVKILPAIPSRPGENFTEDDHGKMGLGVTMLDLFESAYNFTQGRIIIATPLPEGAYDFMANLPNGAAGPALQQEITKQFRLVGKKEVVETNVFLLVLRNPNAPELKVTASPNEVKATRDRYSGSYWVVNRPISDLAGFLEDCLKTPVVDQTGLTKNYDIEFIGGSTPEGLKRMVLHEVGLELVPSRAPIEYLVIEKAN